jgi:hypothetical protein
MVNLVDLHQDSKTLAVSISSVAQETNLAGNDDRVRVVEARSEWNATPMPNGEIRLELSAHLDPAGPLPSWLLNVISLESPYDILKRLRSLVASDRGRVDIPVIVSEPFVVED